MGRFPDGFDLAPEAWPAPRRLNAFITPDRLLIDRPDLKAAFCALRAADHDLAAAIADRLPRINLGLSHEASGGNLGSVGNENALSFTSGLLAPIFDAGRLKAQVALREAEASEALALLEQAMLEAVRQVEDALVREQSLFQIQSLLKNEIILAEYTVDQAKLRYVNGQESFLNVLVAQVNLHALQQREIALHQELLINRSRLLKALGAGWD
jgi:outer membrane protein TolC